MALQLAFPSSPFFLSHSSLRRYTPLRARGKECVTSSIPCIVSSQKIDSGVYEGRLSSYKKSIWDYDFVQSLQNDYTGVKHHKQIEKLKEEVRRELNDHVTRPSAQMELIDAIQRLGLRYHFEKEIKRALDNIYMNNNLLDTWIKADLSSSALWFRLLRQHGYEVSPDVFNDFKDDTGSFSTYLCEDVKGMLSLYEASHLGFEGENVLDEAKSFTSANLKQLVGNIDPKLGEKVTHALELPLHWRMPRLESRWYIHVYQREENMNPTLLELAKFDFNVVQAIHQKDLKVASRWWRHLGIADKLNFARDRLVECFFWSVGLTFEPHLEYCRECLTKVINMILVIDDIYDIYGSLEELELFTNAVDRWDKEAMKQLPDYMKLSFLALYDISNGMANQILKEQGWDILPYLKKVWTEFCKALLVEAKWYNKGYTPSLQEYLNNGWISSAGTVVLIHIYFATKQKITSDALEGLQNNQDIIRYSSMLLRLCNDLGTSKAEEERGDVSSSIQCYMRDTNASEHVARKYITSLIVETWKKMNKTMTHSSFSLSFLNFSMNLARMSHCVYQYGDGLGVQNNETKDHIMSLLVKSIVKGTQYL